MPSPFHETFPGALELYRFGSWMLFHAISETPGAHESMLTVGGGGGGWSWMSAFCNPRACVIIAVRPRDTAFKDNECQENRKFYNCPQKAGGSYLYVQNDRHTDVFCCVANVKGIVSINRVLLRY